MAEYSVTSAAIVRQLLEVLLKEIIVRKGQMKGRNGVKKEIASR
jgi:hypothetical protein